MQYNYLYLFLLYLNFKSYSQTIEKKGITIYEYSDSGTFPKINTNFIIPKVLDELKKGIYRIHIQIQKDCSIKVQSIRKNQEIVDTKTSSTFREVLSKIPFKYYCNDTPISVCDINTFVLVFTITED